MSPCSALSPPWASADNVGVEPFESTHDLIAGAQAGDRRAMDRLLEILRPQLESLARGYAHPGEADDSTSDLVQEAWLRAWQRLEQFQGGVCDEETLPKFRAWVAQIVHRLGLNRVRDRRTQRRQPAGRAVVPLQGDGLRSASDPGRLPEDSGPTPSAVVQVDEEARLVQEAIDALPEPEERTIIRLRFFEGLSLREISERLKLSYDGVRDRYRKSMKVLERRLGGL